MNPFHRSPQAPQGAVTEYVVDDKNLTNHQRIKDREMQRAMDAGADVPFLPTKQRARRAGTTQKRIIEEYANAHSMPVQGPQA